MSSVRIKVCGLTSVAEALSCAQLGVDWLGLNFHPPSARYVDEATAASIISALPDTTAAVALFVNRPPSEIAAIAARIGARTIQLHGEEPPEDLGALGDFTIIRAFRLAHAADIDRMMDHLERAQRLGRAPDAVLVDAYVAGQPGGTGQPIGDELLDRLAALELPRLILSGGLNPQNVGERVARIRPWMVDVATGVESAPGRKDLASVGQFVRAARGMA